MSDEAELEDIASRGQAAYEAMDAWVSRPLGTAGVAGKTLEAHARDLRECRERVRALIRERGERDDLTAALARIEDYHRKLGLTLRDDSEDLTQ